VFPRTLSENSGLDVTEVLSKLYSAHHIESTSATEDESLNKSGACIGIDIENDDIVDVTKLTDPVLDVLVTKQWAIKFATDAALTVLRVDQVFHILIIVFCLDIPANIVITGFETTDYHE
jgi:T-complex protein 1 subunit theta